MRGLYKHCTECGMEEAAWKGHGGQGYLLQSEWYCCRGCAEGSECLCREEEHFSMGFNEGPAGGSEDSDISSRFDNR